MTDTRPAPEARAQDAARQALELSSDWLKPLMAAPGRSYARLLAFSAERLHAHADFLDDLSRCEDLPQLIERQGEYAQACLTACSQEALDAFEAAREDIEQDKS